MRYAERWSYLYNGHNKSRGTRWTLVDWADLQPDDVVCYIDDGGRHQAGHVKTANAFRAITRPQMFGKSVLTPSRTVVYLTETQIKRGKGKGTSFFRYAERPIVRKRKKKKFKPRTL